LTGRQVHRLAGTGSEAGVRKVLERLVDHGVVDVDQVGRSLLYVANRHHLAWPGVESLLGMRETLLARLRTELQSWPVEPISAALFGSAARGDGDTRSDIDVLLIPPNSAQHDSDQWQNQLEDLREHVMSWTGNRCQIYEIGVDELVVQAGEAPIVREWDRDAIPLHGIPIVQLIQAAPRER